MNRVIVYLLLVVVCLSVAAGAVELAGISPSVPSVAQQTAPDAAPAPVPPPATKLKVRLAKPDGNPADLLDPVHKGWESALPTHVLLNRTPRVYQTEKLVPAQPGMIEARAIRADKGVIVRLVWKDATRNAPEAPPRRPAAAGEPARQILQPTAQTNAFPDAAAVMLPSSYQGGDFPSLVMGDGHGPVRLYYWNASRGAEHLSATGRAHVERTGQTFRHQAKYHDGQWAVTLEVPVLVAPYPVAFAIWDGELGDRDGLKMFSIWYVLE